MPYVAAFLQLEYLEYIDRKKQNAAIQPSQAF
jgi:hypothetical protein